MYLFLRLYNNSLMPWSCNNSLIAIFVSCTVCGVCESMVYVYMTWLYGVYTWSVTINVHTAHTIYIRISEKLGFQSPAAAK